MPASYFTMRECATALAVSRQRVRQLFERQQLPTPDAYAGHLPLWERTAFEAFADQRKAQLAEMPNGLNWRHAATRRPSDVRPGPGPTRADDTAVLPGGRRASLAEILALRDDLTSSR